MLVTPTARKRTTRLAAAGLATAVAFTGAAFGLAASPATAAGGSEWNDFIAISKTDSVTGAELDGAVFRVEVTNPTQFSVSPNGHFDEVNPSTWSFASAAEHPPMTVDEYITFEIDRHNSLISQNQTTIDGYLAQVLDPATIAAHAATIAKHQAGVDAAQPYNDANAAATAESQRLADEILALQNAGEPVPMELAQAHADAQQAQTDAIDAAAPYNDAVAALAGGAQIARSALDASNAAQAELDSRFPGGYLPWTIEDNGVNIAAFVASQPAWADAEAVKTAAGLAQAECNAQWGVSTEPTLVSGSGASAIYSYTIATCDGVATLPIGSYAHSITEIETPEGYMLDDTRYEVVQVSEAGFTFNGETYDTRGAVLPIVNTAVPPTEAPVTPTPETLAMTGGDSEAAWSIGGIALLALFGGAGAYMIRRRQTA